MHIYKKIGYIHFAQRTILKSNKL